MQLVAWEGMANDFQPDYPPIYRPQVPARQIVPALWFWLVCLITTWDGLWPWHDSILLSYEYQHSQP